MWSLTALCAHLQGNRMAKQRIDKLIASQGTLTRSDAVKLIKSGAVAVNGKVIKSGSEKADPDSDIITVNSKRFVYKKNIYIMLNKPQGIVSASRDPKEKTVIDLVPDEFKREGLFPAGRLDKDTTGFVLITDDGEFAHNILSPKHHIRKTYIAETDELIAEHYIDEIKKGMILGEEQLLPAEIKLIAGEKNHTYEIVLHEGRYHQIKRMIASSEVTLLSLKRIKMGDLELDGKLAPGEMREITAEELNLIRQTDE